MNNFYSAYVNGRIKRCYKGKSQINFPDTYTVIDLETTGLDPLYDDIIELAALKIKNNEIIDSLTTLVRPLNFNGLDDFISELTGITNKDLLNAPILDKVLTEYVNFTKDDIIVGHNINFDINFLYDNCIELLNQPYTNDFVDTLRLSRHINKELKSHRLDVLLDKYNINHRQSHRSLNDCMLTNELYHCLKNDVINQHSNIDIFIELCGYHQTYSIKNGRIQTDKKTNSLFYKNEHHAFYGKTCVITGVLQKYDRQDAMSIINQIGGLVGNNVTKSTNFLILGNNDYCKTIKDGKSTKQKKAEELILKGHDITIISENIFYELIDEAKYE